MASLGKYKITLDELLMGRDKEYPLTPKLYTNAVKLLVAVNFLREKYGKPMVISSGYRPDKYNREAGGAPTSPHLTCEAIDIFDRDRSLTEFILDNPKILEELDLYMEDPGHATQWVHVQIRSVKTGNRIFLP